MMMMMMMMMTTTKDQKQTYKLFTIFDEFTYLAKFQPRQKLYYAVQVIIKKGSRAKSNGKWKSNGKCSTSRNQFL